MGVLPAYIHVHHVYTWYSQRSEEGAGSLSTEITCGCETPCRCWGWNLGHLQDQQMILTIPAPLPLYTAELYSPVCAQTFCGSIRKGCTDLWFSFVYWLMEEG